MPSLVLCVILCLLTGLGLGWSWAARLAFSPSERLLATAVLSGLLLYLLALAIYVLGLPLSANVVIGPLAILSLLSGRKALQEVAGSLEVRAILAGLALLFAWCLVLDWTVPCYSGGAWFGDFEEHWARSLYWLDHWPVGAKFLRYYSITARPPLVNLEVATLLGATTARFAEFQVAMLMLGGLAFIPAALLALRWGGRRAVAILTVFFLVSPVVLSNATFPWTKLPAAFWILSSLYFYLRSQDEDAPPGAPALAGIAMGCGVLAHYSALPYAVALGVAGVVAHGRSRGFVRRGLEAVIPAGVIVATWLEWALVHFGVRGTFFATTTTMDAASSPAQQASRVGGNLLDTLFPVYLTNGKMDMWLVKANRLGYLRDRWYHLAHANLFVAVGCTAWLVFLVVAGKKLKLAAPPERRFWVTFAILSLLLGIAASGDRDFGGLAHICLLSLTILATIFLAANWAKMGRALRVVLGVGLAVDFVLGVALQFFVQSWVQDQWIHPGFTQAQIADTYSLATIQNSAASLQVHLAYIRQIIPLYPAVALILLVVIGAWAALRVRRTG